MKSHLLATIGVVVIGGQIFAQFYSGLIEDMCLPVDTFGEYPVSSLSLEINQPTFFTGVTVIDVEEGIEKPDMSVIIMGHRITAVGSVDEIDVLDGATTIDGTGKYLILGLLDMHTHISSDRISREILFPLFIAHGVTGIRSMATDCFEAGEPNCEEEPVSTIVEVRERHRSCIS